MSSMYSLTLLATLPFYTIGEHFVEFTLKHRNHVVPPCANFYRHVCPVDIQTNETAKALLIGEKRKLYAEHCSAYIQNDVVWSLIYDLTVTFNDKDREMQRVEFFMKELRWRCATNTTCYWKERLEVQKMDDAAGPPKIKKDVPPNIEAMENYIRSVYSRFVYKELKTFSTMNMLRNILLNICVLEKEIVMPYDLMVGQQMVAELQRKLLTAARKRMERAYRKNPNARMGVEWLETTSVHSPFEVYFRNRNFMGEVYQLYYRSIGRLNESRSLLDVKLTLTKTMTEVESFLTRNGFEPVFMQLRDFNIFNAFNTLGRLVTLMDLTGYLFTRKNVSDVSKFATAGRILGHELGHSFVTPRFPGPAKNCTIEHYQEVCSIFQESSCHSGDATYNEDGADQFGLSVSYDAFVFEKADDLKTVVEETDITNQQMYFYTLGSFFCSSYVLSQHNGNEVHSSTMARLNGMTRGFPPFQEAFGCRTGDPMFIDEDYRCDIFEGQSRKKTMEESSLPLKHGSTTLNFNLTIAGNSGNLSLDFT